MVKIVKKIAAISGAHGFIAQHLTKALEDKGYEVYGIPRNFLFEPDKLRAFFLMKEPELIFHLAAYGNHYEQNKENEIIESNYLATFSMLKASKEINYKAFVNVSSSSVTLPHETFYSATKAGAERLAKAFCDEYQKPIVTVRPYTVIGKGESPKHLIPTLIRSCELGEPMKFVGEPTHDYIDVRDFVGAVLTIVDNIGDLKGKSVPIGMGKKITNEYILSLVEKALEKSANIERVSQMRQYDTKDWVSNPEIIKSLGWKNTHTLEETIQWMIYDREQGS